jgi:hypothetical protein
MFIADIYPCIPVSIKEKNGSTTLLCLAQSESLMQHCLLPPMEVFSLLGKKSHWPYLWNNPSSCVMIAEQRLKCDVQGISL